MAKKFKYRLETVLNLQSKRVSEAKDRLNSIMIQRLNIEHQIQDRQNYLFDDLNKKAKLKGIRDLQAAFYHKKYVEDEIKKLEYDKEQLRELEDYSRLKLSEAMKKEKVLDKLKVKQKAKFKLEMDREEMATFDELAISRHQQSNIED